MSRWRPPNTDIKTPYITAEGFLRLKSEYDHLWRERRPEVVRAITAAAAEGDRSENAEYIYRKKELREIDRRVHYLQKRLPDLKVVADLPRDKTKIFFGAVVLLADENNEDHRYRIVGGDESQETTEGISVDSPLARALLGKCRGDLVQLELHGKLREWEVLEITYR